MGTLSRPSIGGLGPGAYIEEDFAGGQPERLATGQAHFELLRTGEGGLAPDQVHAGSFEASLVTGAEALHHFALALAHLDHIDGDWPVVYAVVRRTAVEVSHLRAGDHGLGRGAAHVDAGAAHVLALHDRRIASGTGQGASQRVAALAGAYNDGVVVLCRCHRKAPFQVVAPSVRCATGSGAWDDCTRG